MTVSFASSALAWLLTYAVHSTVLLGMAWLVLRIRRADPATADVLWKVALVGALVTATAQSLFEIRPAGSVALQSAVVQPAELAALVPAGQSTMQPAEQAANEPKLVPSDAVNAASLNTEQTAPRWNISTPTLLAGGWLLAALALMVWYVGRRLILVGRLGDRRMVHDGELATLLADLRREAGVSRRVILTASQSISSPVALGRNEICLPAAAMSELDPAQQRAMLAHELAHLVRRDPQWLAFACLMERAFFFQPLNRLARRGMQQSAEYLADEWAAERSGGVPLAHCLVKVAEWIQASPLGVPVAGMAEERSQLAARVSRLLERSPFGAPRSRRPLAFLSTGALAAVVVFAPAVTQHPATPVDPSFGLFDPGLEQDQGSEAPNGSGTAANTELNTESDTEGKPKPFRDEPLASAIDNAPTVPDGGTNRGVAAVEDTAVVRALMARLQDEDAEVREAAAHALGRIGDRMAIPALLAALTDDEPDVVRAAVEALTDFDGGVPAGPIRPLLASRDADVRRAAVHILGELRDRESVPALARLVGDENANVRRAAIHALGEIKDPASARTVAGALRDVDADVRQQALRALSELGGTVPEEAIRLALRDADKDVRDAAIHLVEERRIVAMVPELIRMLDDTSAEIRKCAAEALTEMRTEQSHNALKAALTHRDPAVRRVAVEYFGEENDR